MIIQEKSTEKTTTPLRVESPLRSLADEPKGFEAVGALKKDEQVEETSGEESRLDRKSIEKVLAEAEQSLAEKGVALKFSISEDSDDLQVEVRDAGSNKVIRKIPTDEVVRLSQSIKDMSGVFMDKPA